MLVVLRLILAANIPISFDEAYYWLWSKHLAAGYATHPPVVAILIRASTMLAGDREFGVRFLSVLLALPMSWAVYQAALTLFQNERIAASAAIFLNATLMVAAGTIIVTPDAPLMLAAAFLLYFLAKVLRTGSARWWIAIGAVGGIALATKYNSLFFAVAIILWLILVPELRQWFARPPIYIAAAIAIAVFSPVLFWNAEHGWISFHKQFGRLAFDQFTLRYLAELLPGQLGLATPPVFVLGACGLIAMLLGRGADRPARILLGLMVWPVVAYLVLHSLHDRGQGNWFAPAYPAFAIAAGVAAENVAWQGFLRRVIDVCRRWSLATGVIMLLMVGLQAAFGILPLGREDPTARTLGAGFPQLASSIDSMRASVGATAIITTSYAVNAWLSYYLRGRTTVLQINEPNRADDFAVGASILERVLYVAGPAADRGRTSFVRAQYRSLEQLTELERKRRGTTIDTYQIDLATGWTGGPQGSSK
jgi:4-amino-4-deoxy-L-arabinose transferase-like glycosyltransferase